MAQENRKTPDITSLENWLWDCACSIRGTVDALKCKDYIMPLIFAKRMSDAYLPEWKELGSELKGTNHAA